VVTSAVFVQEPKGPAELQEPEDPGQPDEPKEPAELREPEVPSQPDEPKEPVELRKPKEPEEDPGRDEWPPDGNNRPLPFREDRPRQRGAENAAEEDAVTALLEEEARENCKPEPRRIVLTPENIAPRGKSTRAIREASSRGRAAKNAESTRGWYGCRSGHRRSTEGS
jgi:type IV secretory pathway VirB10-like protein